MLDVALNLHVAAPLKTTSQTPARQMRLLCPLFRTARNGGREVMGCGNSAALLPIPLAPHSMREHTRAHARTRCKKKAQKQLLVDVHRLS